MVSPRGIFAIASGFGIVALGSAMHFIPSSPASQWITMKDESVWSHQYILLWPFFISSVILWGLRKSIDPEHDVFLSQAIALLIGLILMPCLFYMYTLGHIENAILAVDISIFVVAVVAAEIIAYFIRMKPSNLAIGFGIALTLILLAVTISLSYASPNSSLFEEHGEEHGKEHGTESII